VNAKELSASSAGAVSLGRANSAHRLGFRAMGLTSRSIWRPPKERNRALALTERGAGVNFVDTGNSDGPHIRQEMIAKALFP
jgi:pyridoxine 4-dehydrogenase